MRRIFAFLSIRFILYVSTFGLYPLYSCYLIYNIVKDKSNLKVDQIFLNEIDVPDIAICGTRELKILRCDLITNNVENSQLNGCNNYVLPDVVDYDIYREHCLTFKANKTIKFTKPDIGGLNKIGFYFYDNTTATEANTIGIASLTILVIPSDFNPMTNSNKAISQMDKATLSELKLQLNFIAGMARYAAVVKFKTSTYRSILSGDVSAILGFRPNYHVTSKIENFINYFPFNNNPYNMPEGTTGYFSVAAGSFIQEQISEERSNTIYSAISAAGGAFGILGGVMSYSLYSLISTRSYPKSELKFSKINSKDKKLLVNEFNNIRYTIYYHLLNQSNIYKMNKDRSWLKNRLENKLKNKFIKFYHWLLNVENIEEIFHVYEKDREYYKFSSINEEDERLLNNEINKIRYVIDVYLYGTKSKDQKKLAAYKYERELKFSDDLKNEDNELQIINEKDRGLLNAEFRKIRKLVDKHLLGKPDIEEIFDAYNYLQNNDFSEDMDEDKKLLNNVFQQISYVIFRHLLDIPEDEEIFNKYKENVQISSFSTNMNNGDKKLLVDEFDRIKHIINSHLFNGRKTLEVFEKYIEERELKFSNNMSEKDKKLLNDKFREIRKTIDNFLLNEPRIQTNVNFSEKMDSKDKELLTSYINEIRKIRHDVDKYILNKV
ncbi:unnamed protein product [Rhizophagus irregularis]|uniref:Uncharacterized protein n=2 Tax=Rhizophagus irregularis TaxID=588596 RepID=A0A915YYS7_9GLOM|nr:unnamed protein product [Rhizophagus irregularis]CAB5190429.1 unnamed protein product [Rhizophagus irregularis]CAB5353558.1 unnamed protein product [Rhizophagus irregularis]